MTRNHIVRCLSADDPILEVIDEMHPLDNSLNQDNEELFVTQIKSIQDYTKRLAWGRHA